MKTRLTAPLHARTGDPRGQVLVLFALVLVVLLLVSALAVDYGGWLVSKRNYQNFSDAAALAGAQQLTGRLTAPCPSGPTKNFCARQAAWESVKTALGLTLLNPVNQAAGPIFNTAYEEHGYKIWVASPPIDANTACPSPPAACPTVYPGHVSGPGVVFVRVDHAGMNFLSGIASIDRTVTAWSAAGRFGANFAALAMCSPTSITARCLAGDANIKLDGSNTNLIINTGDLGTNRWVKTGGSSSGLALGADSNAYMQLFDTCWANSTGQCQLWGYNDPNIDYSTTRSAIPLGAPIPDPAYAAPTISSATAPWQCYPWSASPSPPNVQLASVLERGAPPVENPPIQLAAAVAPRPDPRIQLLAGSTISGTVKQTGGANVPNGILVEIMNSSNNVVGSDTTKNGAYSINSIANGTYTVRATQSGAPPALNTTTSTSFIVPGTTTMNIVMQLNPIIRGTIRDSSNNNLLTPVSISITGPGGPYSGVTVNGVYSVIVYYTVNSSFIVNGTYPGYVANSGNVGANVANLDTTTTVDFNLTPSPASMTGTVTDGSSPTSPPRPVPGVVVSLTQGGSTTTATTDASGVYSFPSVSPNVSSTLSLGGSAMTGYVAGLSTPASPLTFTTTSGTNTKNFSLWPKGCKDLGGSRGDWSCSYPSGNNCPSTTNASGANVSCVFTQANAIRPGTYNSITLPNNTCAWIDPRGGVSGLDPGQSAGIVHIKQGGTISIGNNSYLFGDGVTIVMDQGTGFSFGNSGGFVLNYGSLHNTPNNAASGCNLSSRKQYNDGYAPCFRTVDDGNDYAYAAWTTKGHNPWACSGTQASPPVYSTSCVAIGQELGITFYLYGSGLDNNSRFKNAGNGFGFLFNGVLYGPNDDINIGGGSDAQTAAGQIVGWTIEYHGGTRILQNWYGDPIDGQPFLIEPVLGE